MTAFHSTGAFGAVLMVLLSGYCMDLGVKHRSEGAMGLAYISVFAALILFIITITAPS